MTVVPSPAILAGLAAPAAHWLRGRFALRMRWHLLAFAAAMFLPLLAFALIEADDVADARRAEAVAQMQALALTSAESVGQGLATMRAMAQVLALSPELASGNVAGFRRAADEVARDRGVSVVLRDRSGAQRVATRAPADAPPPSLPSEDPEARAAVRAGRSYVSNVFTSGMTDPFLMRVVVPATFGAEAAAEPGWAVEIAFTPEQVRHWLDAADTPPDWAVTVVGGNGIVIARNKAHADYVGRGTSRDELGPLNGLAGDWRGELLDGRMIAGIYRKLPGAGWIVTAGASEAALTRPRQVLLLRLAALATSLAGLGILVSALMARRIERDTAALARAAEILVEGLPATSPMLPIVEFQAVGRALGNAGHEIQARAQVERALLEEVRHSRDLLRAVVDGTVDPIFARDLQGRFVLVNRAGAAVLGMEHGDDLVGRRVAEALPGPEAEASRQSDRQVAVGGAALMVDDCMLDEALGATRRYQVSKSPWQNTDGSVAGVVCVARDITERTEAEARLRALQADLARAGRLSAVAAMAAGLAHELNQPLSAATNFLAAAESLIGRAVPAGPLAQEAPAGPLARAQEAIAGPLALAQEAIAEASAQMLRAGDIVRRLRGFIGQEAMAMHEEPLAPLVEEAALAAWQHAADPAAQLHCDLDPAITALVDPVQLQQLVANLVRNAAEALQAGSTRHEVWIGLQRTEDGGCVVSVADSGPGLDLAAQERLFDVFERSGKAGGMGVGLAISRTIVAAHGGHIWAEGNASGGATFRFTLPPANAILGAIGEARHG